MPSARRLALSLLLLCCGSAISQTAGYTNSPYTATKKISIIQKLADGTTLTRVSTTTEARDSQGRTMLQTSQTGIQGQNFTHSNVMDPVARTNTIWSPQGKQATRIHMPDIHGTAQPSGAMSTGFGSGSIGTASNATSFSQTIHMGGSPTAPEMVGTVTLPGGAVRDPNLKPTRQVEKLGSRNIAGVYAEGTRTTTTYPVGFFGNDKPIVTVHESWTSPDLKLLMSSIDDDPRTGTRITETTNLDRGEPNPALFQVPEGYTIKDQYFASNQAPN